MRFSRGEVVFYGLKIGSKTVNIAEVSKEKVEGGVSGHLVLIPEEQSDQGTYAVPSPEGDSEKEVKFVFPRLNNYG